ncbi:MAG: ATP-grasp domain-containing protein [Ignavibacteriae bacterium]|nr:MAG: ATP-grasp domain-containing protein [Ignavibacteriota bacterium]
MMLKMTHIAVIFNEPTISTDKGRMFISAEGQVGALASHSEIVTSMPSHLVDMSEVGVIEEREQVEKALQDKGYRTSLFNIDGDIKRLIKFIEVQKPDIIFNLCESLMGESLHEMHVAGIYELMNVPYTGAATLALGTCLDKVRTKDILRAHGIPTAKHLISTKIESCHVAEAGMHFPLIVKPIHEDASMGIENSSVVTTIPSLQRQIAAIIKSFNEPALVEEYIEGRELNVAIIGNEEPMVLPISEIDFSKLPPGYPKIVTYNAKWVEGTPEYTGTVGTCPAPLERAVEERVKEVALKAYQLMEIRDYARVDIRLDASNTPYVLEVNPNPDISCDAGFARSARAAGMTFDDMIVRIVETALERSRR